MLLRSLLPETNLTALSQIHAIEPAAAPAPGPGLLVTGRYVSRLAGNLVEVELEDGSSVCGTGNHPVWSKTRRGWIALEELRPGELLAGRSGPVAVVQVKRLPGSGRVYNLEIHGQHVYRVGPAGVLVHNNGGPCPAFDTQYGRYTRTVHGYKHALSPEHVRAAAREKAGEVVARRADGTPFDHLTETRRAIAGAKDRIRWLKKHLSDPNLTEAQRQIIEDELREFSLLLDFARRVLHE